MTLNSFYRLRGLAFAYVTVYVTACSP